MSTIPLKSSTLLLPKTIHRQELSLATVLIGNNNNRRRVEPIVWIVLEQSIRLTEKFLSFYKETIDARHFCFILFVLFGFLLFYRIFYWNKYWIIYNLIK